MQWETEPPPTNTQGKNGDSLQKTGKDIMAEKNETPHANGPRMV